MPSASQTANDQYFVDPCLAYSPYGSFVDPRPQIQLGQNIRTSQKMVLERRPGFADGIESTITNFVASLSANAVIANGFVWRRWDDPASGATRGNFIVMLSVTDAVAGSSSVYYLNRQTMSSFALLYRDASSTLPFYFVNSNNTCYYSNGASATSTRKFDGTNDWLWGIVSPSAAPTVDISSTSGTLTSYEGFCWLYTYYNPISSHESSPSANSICAGIFTSKTAILTLAGTTDTQVTQVRVYRTTDGGSTSPTDMREVSGSPFAIPAGVIGTTNTFTVSEQTADTALGSRTAPALLRNDPPPPMKGLVHTNAGRIVGFSANKVYYSGFEEISFGVPEECFPSGLDGNFFPYDSEITGLAKLSSGVAVFTSTRIHAIEGDTLDTLRRYVLAENQGVRSHFNIATYANTAFWLDTAGTIWMLGGQETGLPIRTDIAGLDQSKTRLVIYLQGDLRLLCLLSQDAGKMWCYDFDTQKWMPPWTVSASALFVGETSSGNFSLLAGLTSPVQCMALNPAKYNDAGTTYSSQFTTNQLEITPQGQPDHVGVTDFVAVEGDSSLPSKVELLTDEDPTTGSPAWQDITANIVDADLRTQGVNLQEHYYKASYPTARRAAFRVTWNAADSNFKVYGIGLARHSPGV